MAQLSERTLAFATDTAATRADYKANLIKICIAHEILTFGTFKLKSGRLSPYFFNAGSFYTASTLDPLCTAYARTILAQTNIQFDVIFGPAYKGIPLATLTCYKLGALDSGYSEKQFAFNRKEVKDHGEGGLIVGAPLKGKRVLIIDDVITSGKAINEGVEVIKAEGGTLVGIVVALDRMEKMPSENDDDGLPRRSAIGEVRERYGVPVFSILTIDDIVDSMRNNATNEEVKRIEEYRSRYRASD